MNIDSYLKKHGISFSDAAKMNKSRVEAMRLANNLLGAF
jgi:hypothetical protein